MANYEKKIFYVTQEQYDILKDNGTVGSYTGIDPDATYFVRPIPDNYELVWNNDENQIQLLKNADGSGDPITIQYASYAANAGSLGGSSASDFVNVSGEQTITGPKTFSSTILGSISGNAGTATKLATARTIGGVSFDGTANINLPGVNTTGNQNTTGNAGTATKLANARTIGGVSFDGTANINLPGVNTTGNQSTTGNAGSATKLQTARLFTVTDNDGTNSQNASSSFDGSSAYTIKLPSTIKAALSGNAATATTLQTARTINVGTGVSGTATSFNGSSNITIPVTGVSESYLTWGGKSLNGQVTPIGMSLSNEHSANRLAFINGDSLYFEYSSDGGSTWTDYGYNASTKSQFCTTSLTIPIGRVNTSTEYTTLSRTRITLTAQNGTTSYIYTNPRKMLLETSSGGGMQVLVETRTGANYQSGGVWSTFGTYTLSGWSGWNDIPLVLGTLGGGTNQTGNIWQLRLTFIMTSEHATNRTNAEVRKLRIYGENDWGLPSTMAKTGNLYSFDMSQNATFPAKVTAPTFAGALTGNAGTATKLETARTIGGVSFDGTANINLPGVNTSGTQNTSGNAATATKLQTARTLTIGSTGKTFNGEANVAWTLAEIGAAAASHTHDDRYFTETEVTNLLAAKANLTGANFTGNVTASDGLNIGTVIPKKGDGSTIYYGTDTRTLIRASGVSGFYVNSARRNLFYCLTENAEYECTSNYWGNGTNITSGRTDGLWVPHTNTNSNTGQSWDLGRLFDNNFTSGATFPVANLASKPLVITIVTTGVTPIDYTDTLYLVLNGWRYDGVQTTNQHYGKLNDYSVEVCTDKASDTWVKVFERTGVVDSIDGLYIPLWSSLGGAASYVSFYGVRLTVTEATQGGIAGVFGLTEIKLMENRPRGLPSDSVGALSLAGGRVYGNIILGSKFDQVIRPSTNKKNYIGTSAYQFNAIYGQYIYEDNQRVYSPNNKPTLAEIGAQSTANIQTTWGANPTNTTYPSAKLVKDTIDNLVIGTVTTVDGGNI